MKRTIAIFLLVWSSSLSIAQVNPDTEKKITVLLSKLTLNEKIGMIHGNTAFSTAGVPRLNIPPLIMSDGPHGVNYERPLDWSTPRPPSLDSGTYLPVGICLSSTWNPKLGYSFGSVLGSEAAFRKKDIILGPGINIIRTPLNGRNFEYQSEDPFLISKMVVAYIKGVQDQGVSACVKHFAANNQEVRRNSINVEMSERALREIYLPGFKAAVTEGKVKSVMGAYNKLRGQFATHNKYLINDILKGEWGFKGVLMSDWAAAHDTKEALENGLDIEMGTELNNLSKIDYNTFYMADPAIAMIKSGEVKESLIDEKVRRILRLMYETNMIGDGKKKPGEYNTKQHQQVALKVAEEGIVLLKNQSGLLPFDQRKIKSIAVIGNNAIRLQGFGGGSSQVKAFYEISPLQGIKNLVGKSLNVEYAKGYNDDRNAKADPKLIAEAVALASKSDVVVFVGGWTHGYDYNKWDDNAFDAENVDKPDMNMPFGQDDLILALQKANPTLVVVLIGGGPLDMTAWEPATKAILQAWYPGMEGGNALANILFGKVNPSGKLPITFPKKLEDSPPHKLDAYPGTGDKLTFKEDIFVGYRYFDIYNVTPQFPFGHGLSYTSFSYSGFNVSTTNRSATVSFTITNTGKVAGAEVAQVYVKQNLSTLKRPEKELKGFAKVFLKPGETKKIIVALGKDAFQYFNDLKNSWVLEPGKFMIMAGSSSRDIWATKEINLK